MVEPTAASATAERAPGDVLVHALLAAVGRSARRWGWIFGTRTEDELDPPAGHVRELLLELPDETGSDLLICAGAITRLAWAGRVRDQCPDAGGRDRRLVAARATARAATVHGRVRATGGTAGTAGAAAGPRRRADPAARRCGRPRPGPRPSADPIRKRCRASPRHRWPSRWRASLLVQELTELRAEESDRALQPVADAALRAGIVHLVQGVLLRAVQGQAREYVELRLCAMEQIRRLGGPRTVPAAVGGDGREPDRDRQRAAAVRPGRSGATAPDPLLRPARRRPRRRRGPVAGSRRLASAVAALLPGDPRS